MVTGRYTSAVTATLLWLLCVGHALAADISVETDRSPVSLSESFQIIYEARGGVDDEPDFAPLERDFQIISTSQSSRLNIVNGRSSSTKTWTLTVLARRTGKLTIPPIAFGSDRSPAATVEVTLAATPPGRRPAESGEVFLEVEARPLKPYVQQQILYTVRLFRAFPTANASLSEPQVKQGDAVIERIGEDELYDRRVNGRPYQVVERRYAIFPQASGTLKIGPLTFRSHSGGSPFSVLDPFGRRTELIVRQSAPVELKIRAQPGAAGGGVWLPAQRLSLNQSWSPNPPAFRVGEPVTRTLTMTAMGLTASQLPELPSRVPDQFKAYPDQPALSDDKSADGITGTRVEKVAIIPAAPGVYELPGIRIPWWNTARGRLEVAELPPERIEVRPAAGTAGEGTAPGPAVTESATTQGSQSPAMRGTHVPAIGGRAVSAPGLWQWISAALALLWIGTALAWWKSRRRAPPRPDTRVQRLGEVRRELNSACARNDPAAAKECLLRWAQLRWRQDAPRSIGEIAARSGADLAGCLRDLDAHLYGRPGGAWNGAALRQAFRVEERHGRLRTGDPGSELEPLHRI